jgi:hypothetical protein
MVTRDVLRMREVVSQLAGRFILGYGTSARGKPNGHDEGGHGPHELLGHVATLTAGTTAPRPKRVTSDASIARERPALNVWRRRPISERVLKQGSDMQVSMGSPDLPSRLYHWVLFGSLFLIGAFLVGGGASDLGESLGVILFVVGLLCLTLTEVARRAHLREIDPGFISVDGYWLQINHPALLSEPIRVPIAQVRAAVVDASEVGERAFPLFGERGGPLESAIRGHLLNSEEPFPLRLLGRTVRRPNVVILFEPPVVASVRREVAHGPRHSEELAGIAAWVPKAEEARSMLASYGLRDVLREDDLEVVEAIHAGLLRSPDPEAVTKEGADLASTWKLGWGIAAFGLIVPFVSVWSLPIAVKAWKAREYAHALGITMLAVAIFGVELALVTNPPVDQSWRFSLGIAITALPVALLVVGVFVQLVRRQA